MKSLADTREFCRSFMDQIQAVCPSPAVSPHPPNSSHQSQCPSVPTTIDLMKQRLPAKGGKSENVV